jgi:hypothetical protein
MQASKKPIATIFIIAAPLLILAFYGAVAYTDRYCSLMIHGEGQFIENASVVFLSVGGMFAVGSAVRWQRREGHRHWFFLGLGGLLALAALEELSWGQHLFGFKTPAPILERNAQEEMNLHNFLGIRYLYLIYIPALIYGLLPLAAEREPIASLRARGLLAVPPLALVPLLTISSLISLRLLIDSDNIVTFTYSEVGEMTYALGLAMSMLIHWRALYQGPPRAGRTEAAAWTAVAVLFAAVMAAGMVGSVTHRCRYPENRALARLIDEQTGPEDAIIFVGEAQDARIILKASTRRSEHFYALPGERVPEAAGDILETCEEVLVVYFQASLEAIGVIEETFARRAYPLDRSWHDDIRLDRYLAGEPDDRLRWTPSDARFGDHITLSGFTREPEGGIAPGDAFGVALLWQTGAVLETSYKVFVHVYDAGGALVTQHDGFPAADLIPTTIWLPGESVIDRHGIVLPTSVPPGRYEVAVGLYDPASGERLPVTLADGSTGDKVYLPPLEVR